MNAVNGFCMFGALVEFALVEVKYKFKGINYNESRKIKS